MPIPCPPISFHLTQSQWGLIEQKLQARSIDVEQDTGTVSIGPEKIQWEFDAVAETLTVQCVDHPFYAPCGLINNKLREAFQSAVDSGSNSSS